MNVGGNIEWIIFVFFAVLSVVSGFGVVVSPGGRNPIASAMCLVVCLGSMAGLFALLGAYFLAAVQLLVYAGAVVVLFLFVIMVWGNNERRRGKTRKFGLVVGGASTLVMLVILVSAMIGTNYHPLPEPGEGNTQMLGKLLTTKYVLAFELLGILLVAGVIGVVFLGKKHQA